jgi:2-phospho-L-lactate guanylyltransferase
MIVVAVPVKDLVTAKQRLVPALGPEQRALLARAMLCDVLRAVGAAGPDAVWVVTRDPDVAAIAAGLGAEVIAEAANDGHTAAVARAQAEAVRRGALLFATVPGDVPCLEPAEVTALVTSVATPPGATFVPSRSGRGTNGVALVPPALMPLTFGEPSFDNHLAEARRRGVVPRVLPLPGLGLDVDGPADLRALAGEGRHTESGRLLAGWGVAAVAREAGTRSGQA